MKCWKLVLFIPGTGPEAWLAWEGSTLGVSFLTSTMDLHKDRVAAPMSHLWVKFILTEIGACPLRFLQKLVHETFTIPRRKP